MGENLRLIPIDPPTADPIDLEPHEVWSVGRSSQAKVILEAASVSRLHARIECRDGQWSLTDLGSTHGSLVDSVPCVPNEAVALPDGCSVSFGPLTYQAQIGDGLGESILGTLDDRASSLSLSKTLTQDDFGELSQRRLMLLMEGIESLAHAEDIADLADGVIALCLDATGYEIGACVRPLLDEGGRVKLLACRTRDGYVTSPTLSRSLIEHASQGRTAQLDHTEGTESYGQSVIDLGIRSALCVPMAVGPSVEACLYLDARSGTTEPDSAVFAASVARIAALSMSNLRRVESERMRLTYEADLKAAREAQSMMLPPGEATHGRVRYAVVSKPGRQVAGDLYDVIPLEDGRVAFFLGDVSGKGAGAGMTMAVTQALLRASIENGDSPAAAVHAVNRALVPRMAAGRFVSLWIGILDPTTGKIMCVDAGHGHALRAGPNGFEPIECVGAIPVGLDPETVFSDETITLATGERVILYSDGAVEQDNPLGAMLGLEGLLGALEGSTSPEQDVRTVIEAVERHAGGSELGDDLSVASFELGA